MKLYPDRWEMIDVVVGDGPAVWLFRIRGNDVGQADYGRLAALSAPRSLDTINR